VVEGVADGARADPLTGTTTFDDPAVTAIAAAHGKTKAQVMRCSAGTRSRAAPRPRS
jgi:hypothetical protein